jgi:hypothetical protein
MPSDRGFYYSSAFIDSGRFSTKGVLCASWASHPKVHQMPNPRSTGAHQ